MIEQNGRQLLGLGGSVRQGRANEVVVNFYVLRAGMWNTGLAAKCVALAL